MPEILRDLLESYPRAKEIRRISSTKGITGDRINVDESHVQQVHMCVRARIALSIFALLHMTLMMPGVLPHDSVGNATREELMDLKVGVHIPILYNTGCI